MRYIADPDTQHVHVMHVDQRSRLSCIQPTIYIITQCSHSLAFPTACSSCCTRRVRTEKTQILVEVASHHREKLFKNALRCTADNKPLICQECWHRSHFRPRISSSSIMSSTHSTTNCKRKMASDNDVKIIGLGHVHASS